HVRSAAAHDRAVEADARVRLRRRRPGSGAGGDERSEECGGDGARQWHGWLRREYRQPARGLEARDAGYIHQMQVADPVTEPIAALANGGPGILHALATERAWCREALLRVSRTFALNIRCLSGRMLETVRLAYLLCRAADALEDSWPGPPAEMAARFDALVAALDGDDGGATTLSSGARDLRGRSDVALLVRLPALLRVLASLDERDASDIRRCVRTMTQGMKRFATRAAERGNAVP